MDVRALRYFVEVVKQQSFTRAGESVHVTQPTISKMVKQLEAEVGAPLLVRGARGLQLTDAGRLVYTRANAVLRQIDDLSAEIDQLRHLARGELRLGLPPMIGATFFPPVLGEYRRQYPSVELRLAEYGAKRIEAAVLEGDLDLGVAVLPVDEKIFEAFPFISERLAVVAPACSQWGARDQVDLSELANEPFVLFTEDFRLTELVRKECLASGFSPEEVGHSSHWDFIAAMVAAGQGVTLFPETICERLDPHETATIALASPIPWEVAVIWRRDGLPSFAARAWVQVTRDVLGKSEESGSANQPPPRQSVAR
jgi:DNA-binding transcriptional LysR family regulator